MVEVETLAHPEGRQHEQDMTSDLPGKAGGVKGGGGHAYEGETQPKKQEEINFAKRIARRLEAARNAREYEQLLMICTPAFLGDLRHELSAATARLVCFELNKNLVTHSEEDIRRHLPEYLPA